MDAARLASPARSSPSRQRAHRQFEWATVIDAAVLNVLSDDGLHVLGREDILLALMEARAAYDDWEKNKKPDPYFLIFVSIKGKPFKARSCYWLKGKIKLCEGRIFDRG